MDQEYSFIYIERKITQYVLLYICLNSVHKCFFWNLVVAVVGTIFNIINNFAEEKNQELGKNVKKCLRF